jgi:hypothetical protein
MTEAETSLGKFEPVSALKSSNQVKGAEVAPFLVSGVYLPSLCSKLTFCCIS